MNTMRLDFNSKGSWKHALSFDERDVDIVQHAAGPLAAIASAKARLVNDSGDVCFYYEASRGWYQPQWGAQP